MVRVDALDRHRHFIDGLIDQSALLRSGEHLHFVAEGPHQQGGMVLVPEDRLPGGLELSGDQFGVVVVETLARVTHAKAGQDGESQLLRAVQGLPAGADRIPAGLNQQVQAAGAIHTLYEVRLAVTQQLPAPLGLHDLHNGRGVLSHGGALEQSSGGQSEG